MNNTENNINENELEQSLESIDDEVEKDIDIEDKKDLWDEQSKQSIKDILWENEKLKSDLDKVTRFSAAIKTEFDTVVRKFEIERKENRYLEISKIVAKFQKLLEGMRMFLLHLDDDLAENEQIKWLKIIYESFISQELASMWVHPIVSLWYTPDAELHEVLMLQDPTDQDMIFLQDNNISLDGEKADYNLDDLHGKIIKELEVGYYYFDGEKKVVIKPSKVIVAN